MHESRRECVSTPAVGPETERAPDPETRERGRRAGARDGYTTVECSTVLVVERVRVEPDIPEELANSVALLDAPARLRHPRGDHSS